MKNLLSVLILLLGIGFKGYTQSLDSLTKINGPQITFSEKTKEMPDINYGESVSYTFFFKNTGTDTLVIKNAITTCSCTSRKFTEGPIPPGGEGTLDVTFDSSKQEQVGRQNKVITIISNAVNNPERVILIVNILAK